MSRRGRLKDQQPVTDVEELHAPGEWIDKPQRWLIRVRKITYEHYAFLTDEQAFALSDAVPFDFRGTEVGVYLRHPELQQDDDFTDVEAALAAVRKELDDKPTNV